MNKDIKDKWVAALESGDYPQGTGCLKSETGAYCCLGVLTELAVQAGVVKWHTGKGVYMDNEVGPSWGYLNEVVIEWAELSEDEVTQDGDINLGQQRAVDWNDEHKLPFPQIANLIKEHL
jgi:hypothetical protein